ncbi:MAG TPA: YraN family protein [Devosia sp.]|nr:YraN family protein [Devosia sp.]
MPPSPSRPTSRRPAPFRRFAENAGRRGEAFAALLLQLKGYRILARRLKTPVGELDLIVRRGRVTVFVEVKQRSFSHQEGEALAAVNRRRMLRAAQYWLIRHPDLAQQDLRFDVIFLAPFALPRHIVNAFDATGFA